MDQNKTRECVVRMPCSRSREQAAGTPLASKTLGMATQASSWHPRPINLFTRINGKIARTRRGSAFTLVEVLVSLAIVAVIATASAALMSATAYGTTSGRDLRNLLVKTQTAGARIGTAIRSAQEAVPYGGIIVSMDYVVLWAEDENDDGSKQNNEMRLIALDTASGELRSYRNASDTAAFADAPTFKTLAMASYASDAWTADVTGVQFKIESTGTTLVSYRLTVALGDDSKTAIGAVSPRQ